MLDLFQGRLTYSELQNLPIPILDMLRKGQLEYLKEKRKAEKDLLNSGK